MRKNRKMTKKMSVVATNSMRFGAIIVVFFLMVILNILSSSSCTQLSKAKGLKERELAQLDKSRLQEATRWEEMMSPERMEIALLRHGLKMSTPRPDQIVRLKPNGTPYPGQPSVAKARQRVKETTVSYPTTSKRRRKVR